MSPSQLKFAIVGCGRIAQRHAEHINNKAVLAAVCDIDETKATTLAKQYGANAYYSIEDLLQNEKNINVVSVCTPNGLHAQHAIQSLNAGFHVLCEKPMGLTTAECGQSKQTAFCH
jgi:UDP-N-acetyl-2-amino-2-deoxyglucuronate dehydrogenase